MLKIRISFLTVLIVIVALLTLSCEKLFNPKDEKPVPPPSEVPVNTTITEGPANDASLLYNSSPTFKWKGEVSPGYITGFAWKFEKDGAGFDSSGNWTMDMSKTFNNLTEGSYVFSVWAKDNKDSVDNTPDTRSFKILSTDSIAPFIRFTQGPTDGSYRPPGVSVFFEWTATDSSTFGSVTGYSHRLSGTGASATDWSDWDINTTTAAYSNLAIGSYTFQVKAKDNAGVESDPAEISFEVKTPTILVVDDYTPAQSPFLNEIETDKIVGEILRDWSWEEWDISEKGIPTSSDLSGYTTVIWYVDASTQTFEYFMRSPDSTGYVDNPLDDFLDAGGNLWLMGGEVLYFSYLGLNSWGDLTATNDTVATADSTTNTISGRMSKRPVLPNTITLTDGSEVITDDGSGKLINATSDSVGSITYSSGRFTVTFSTALDSGDVVVADYHHYYQYSNLFDSDQFPGKYLHLTSGGDAGDDEFTGLVSLGVTGFDDIGIPGLATGTGWPDALSVATDATAIYDLGGYDAGTTAGLLYEGTYNVVFWAANFAFVATNHNHLTLSPEDVYPVANHSLETIFGE
jgi:hypothetical protein